VEVAIAIIYERPEAGGPARLLICRRKQDAVLGGYWEFPGGKCHPGEAPSACAMRETQEETGLIVAVRMALPPIEHDYPHARVRLHPFICDHAAGDLELRDVAEAVWISPAALDNYRFPEANAGLIRQLLTGP
jgi:mutator protein MutT